MTTYHPPTVTPPEKPYGFIKGLRVMSDNPVRWWPRQIFEDGLIVEKLGRQRFLHVADPQMIRTVLLDEVDSFVRSSIVLRMLRPVVGDGLLTSDGVLWKGQRSIASPAFRHQEVRALTPIMAAAGERAANRMIARAASEPDNLLDVMPEMVRATFDVIMDTLFDGGEGLFDADEVAANVAIYLDTIGRLDVFDVLNAPQWIPRPWKSKGRKAVARLRAVARHVVAHKKSQGSDGDGLTDRLLRATDPETGERMSDERLLDNLLTFVGAGHETTANALTWTLFLLAEQRELQEKLADEAVRVAGDAPITADYVDQLSLHAQTLRESMRLYPPVAAVGRGVGRDVGLRGMILRPGDHVTLAIYPMHRRAAFWEDPSAFDVTRFAPDAPAPDRYAYLPFGGGPRICIGMAFAMIEAVAILAAILRKARVAPGPAREIEPLLRVSLRPRGGMPLTVTPRESISRPMER